MAFEKGNIRMTSKSATPQRLYLIEVATAAWSKAGMPIVCYLVQTSDGKNILIDSGLPGNFVPPPGLPEAEYGKNVVEQLALLGLQPGNIDRLICTHFDTDHTGYLAFFTDAELIAQRRDYEHASSGNARFAPTRPQWDHPALRYRLIDGDTELLPGLELIATGGHTIGHQSVLVQLPHTGSVLLAIDAILDQSYFTPDRADYPFDEDAEAARTSTIKLLDVTKREGALVIFGHDGAQWKTLKKLPEYYE